MNGPREIVVVWQAQPAGAAERWAQVLGEILPPAIGGPLPPLQQPHAVIVLPGASASVERPAVVELVAALQGWLDRTRWTAELPPPPPPTEARLTGRRLALACGAFDPEAPEIRCGLAPGHSRHPDEWLWPAPEPGESWHWSEDAHGNGWFLL